jgi:hypothetical protein
MYEAKSKTIDGTEFKVQPFTAIEALRLKAYLVKMIGPAFGQLLSSFKKGQKLADMDIDGDKFSSAIEALTNQLGEQEFISFIQRMLSCTSCMLNGSNGKVMVNFADDFAQKMDMVFQGKLFSIYPVMLFVLEVNYPDFFAKVGGFGRRITTAMSPSAEADGSKSPTSSEV